MKSKKKGQKSNSTNVGDNLCKHLKELNLETQVLPLVKLNRDYKSQQFLEISSSVIKILYKQQQKQLLYSMDSQKTSVGAKIVQTSSNHGELFGMYVFIVSSNLGKI